MIYDVVISRKNAFLEFISPRAKLIFLQLSSVILLKLENTGHSVPLINPTLQDSALKRISTDGPEVNRVKVYSRETREIGKAVKFPTNFCERSLKPY